VAVTGVGPERTYEGLQGYRDAWLDWLEPWESYRTEAEKVIDAGDDVLVLVRDHGRRAGMQAEVSMNAAAIWTVRDGKIVRATFFSDQERALEAVGLTE
jgi:ketosteroid isomerase-like protein